MEVQRYRKFRTSNGRLLRVPMTRQEIVEGRIIMAVTILVPSIMFILFVWASGILK